MSGQPWPMRFTLTEDARAGDVLEVFDPRRGFVRRARASAPEEAPETGPEDFAEMHTDAQEDAIHRVRTTPIRVTVGKQMAEGATLPASAPCTAEERAHVDRGGYLSPLTEAWVTPAFARRAVNQVLTVAERRYDEALNAESAIVLVLRDYQAILGYDEQMGGQIAPLLRSAEQRARERANLERHRRDEARATTEALAGVAIDGLFGLVALAGLDDAQFAKQRATGGTGERGRDGG